MILTMPDNYNASAIKYETHGIKSIKDDSICSTYSTESKLFFFKIYAVNIPVNSPIITENTKAPKKSSII